MILAWKPLTASSPSTVSITDDDRGFIDAITDYAHSEHSDLGMIPVSTLLLDTDVVFGEVDLGHGHSLFSCYLRITSACLR